MKKSKLIILSFIIVVFPTVLSGCWDYKEIDTLAIVAGIAIDRDISTNEYIVTTEIITTQAQGFTSNVNSELFTSKGDTIFEAMRNMIQKTGLRLYWSGTKVVIISKTIASQGIIPVIDWTSRDSDVRPDIWIMISKGDSAAEILKHKVKLNEVTSFHLDDTMMSGKILSGFKDSRLNSFLNEMTSEGNSCLLATVENQSSDDAIEPRLSGSAIFKSDKLVGYIDDTETLYMQMIKNKAHEGLIVLKNILGSSTNITLEIFENRTKLTPKYNNGRVSMIIDIYPVIAIDEVQGTKDFMKEENLKMLQSEAEKEIEVRVQSLIDKLQKDYDSDVLGFDETFMREKPKASEDFKKSGEDIFQNMKTVVKVHMKIKGSGKTIKSIPTS